MNVRLALALLIVLPPLVSACSSPEHPTAAAAVASQPMTPGAEPDTMRYVNPNVDLRRYTAFIVDPVAIYNGADAQFGDVSDAEKQSLADYMHSEFVKELSKHHRVVSSAGPNVLRIHLTLAGVETTRPALATVTHLVPAGLAMNLLKGGTGGQGTFMGSVTIAGNFYDSTSNDLVASVLTRQSPNAMALGGVTSKLGAAREGINEAAEKFASAIDKIQSTGRLPPARQ